jgi:hypothetical protein
VAELVLVRPMKTLVLAATLLLSCVAAQARPVRATIYFRGWYAESFAAVPPQALREMARTFPSYSPLLTCSTCTANAASASKTQT